jgi:hypothetical protein
MPVLDFDVSTYEAPKRTSFEPLPPGDYNAMISDSQMKTTKAGTVAVHVFSRSVSSN